MQIYHIYIFILLAVLHGETGSKSISDTFEPSEPVVVGKDSDSPSFKTELPEELSDQGAFVKIPKVNLQSGDAIDIASAKRDALDTVDDGSDENRRIVKIYPKHNRRRSPFGIVYKDGKLLGILEPISRVYEYQSLQDDLSQGSKLSNADISEADVGKEDEGQNFVKRSSSSNKQQVQDKVAALMHPKRLQPIVAEDEDETQMDHSATRIDNHQHHRRNVGAEPKLSAIESNLKAIISDLNTMNEEDKEEEEEDAYVAKRHVQTEDEDLDNGSNRIPIAKEQHEVSADAPLAKSPMKAKKSLMADDFGDAALHNNVKVADYRSVGDSFIRQKRQQTTAASRDTTDIVKGLEASGDLTVSGNKSPLASASAPVEMEAKAKGGRDENFKKRDKQATDSVDDDEARVQRKISDQISAIKAQVKREVQQKMSSERSKRNLLDHVDETEQFDAMRNAEGDSLAPHLRKRRDTAKQTDVANVNVEKREVKSVKAVGDKSAADFQIGPNSNAIADSARALGARVRATRALRPSANDAQDFDAASLKQLVDDSASLTNAVVNVHDEEEAQRVPALAENHAESANLVINAAGEDEIIMKRAIGAHRKQRFRSEDTTPAHFASAADDAATASGAADGGGEQHFLVYEAAAASKTNARSAHKPKSSEIVSEDGDEENTRLAAATTPSRSSQADDKDALEVADTKRSAADEEMTSNVRLERNSPSEEPMLSVEDMQQLDSENSMRRKRRDADEDDVGVLRNRYRGDDDEADEENDEFDDDNFDDRTATMVKKKKRAAGDVVYDGDDYENDNVVAESAEQKNADTNENAREYVAKLNGDVYDNANYLYDANGEPLNRNRRQAATLHSGATAARRFDSKYRKKRLEKNAAKAAAMGNRNTGMAGLTENDIFGGLPQSYEGELTRFKRVKRSDDVAASTPPTLSPTT